VTERQINCRQFQLTEKKRKNKKTKNKKRKNESLKTLKEILERIKVIEMLGNTDIEIGEICFDSRKARKRSLFVAVKGTKYDGHEFIQEVIAKGCIAVICERFPNLIKKEVTYVRVNDSAGALGMIASAFYSYPSEKLNLVGITGTNGKTTIATLLHELFRKSGHHSGLLSTIQNLVNDESYVSTHTTPDAIAINSLLSAMVKSGCSHCFMEVSSHSIDQKRTEGLKFRGGVFTNLTHDHLDYHKDFRAYLKAKKLFFDNLPETAFALVNNDDRNGMIMVQNTKAEIQTYSLKSVSDYKCRILETHVDGMLLKIDNQELWTELIGEFNAYNLLAVYGTAVLLGLDEEKILTLISSFKPVRGRAQTVTSADGITAVIDYAHSPDALENILLTVNKIRKKAGKIITVVGAGGDRDKTKRPLMGKIAAVNSDKVILTSDNPRSEEPENIIDDMKRGISKNLSEKVISITDRREAIKTAFMLAGKGDIILVAGKGHETYQEIKGKKYHFDDMEIINELMKN
jgi:UDP-N-acetylmuramoyl-L-alanyl-D-glutamate--2,6-diaminopimelate ligase